MLAIIAVAVISMVIWAAMFKPVREATRSTKRVLVGWCTDWSSDLGHLATAVGTHAATALCKLVGGDMTRWPWGRVLGAVVYALAFVAAVGSDIAVLALVFEAWGYGAAPKVLAEHSVLFVSVSALVGIMFFGVALADVLGVTDLAPWAELDEPWRERFLRACLCGIGFAFTALLLIAVWKAIQTADGWTFMRAEILSVSRVGSQILVATAVTGAGLIAAYSLFALPIATFGTGLKMVVEWPLRATSAALRWLAMMLNGIERVFIMVTRIPAILGARLWNWIVDLVGRFLHLGKIDIGDDDDDGDGQDDGAGQGDRYAGTAARELPTGQRPAVYPARSARAPKRPHSSRGATVAKEAPRSRKKTSKKPA